MILLAGLLFFGLCVSVVGGMLAILIGLQWLVTYKHTRGWYAGVGAHLLCGAICCVSSVYCFALLRGIPL